MQKVVVAVNKSAERAMIQFSQAELNFICQFVEEKAQELGVPVLTQEEFLALEAPRTALPLSRQRITGYAKSGCGGMVSSR